MGAGGLAHRHKRPAACRHTEPDTDGHRERGTAPQRSDHDDPAGNQCDAPGHAENPAGRVSLGDHQYGTHEQQHEAERGHVKSSTPMIRRAAAMVTHATCLGRAAGRFHVGP